MTLQEEEDSEWVIYGHENRESLVEPNCLVKALPRELGEEEYG